MTNVGFADMEIITEGMKKPDLTVLSLGWGVQSFTMAAMSALGELPRFDFAIQTPLTSNPKHTNLPPVGHRGWKVWG